MYVYMYIYIYKYVCVCACVCARVCVCARIYTHTHTSIWGAGPLACLQSVTLGQAEGERERYSHNIPQFFL